MNDFYKINIMIVGAQKAGTSSLLRYLGSHPAIYAHPQREFAHFINPEHHDKEERQYFDAAFSHRRSHQLLLAKNAMLMYSEAAIERLYAHNSNALIIALLRNPVDRAYSAYWFARSRGWEKIKTFEEALRAEPERLQEDWYKWRNNAYLFNGQYILHLRNLFTRFGAERTQAYLIEDLKSDPQKLFRQIFKAAGVDDAFQPNISRKHNPSRLARSEKIAQWRASLTNSHSNVKDIVKRIISPQRILQMQDYIKRINTSATAPPPTAPETRQRLIEHFQPYNEELGALLGRDLSEWNRI